MLTRFLVLIFVVLAGPALASKPVGILYDCTITQKKERLFWIPQKLAIVIKDNGDAVVFDEVIMRFNDAPMAARIWRDTDRRLVVRWTLKDLVNSANQHTAAFDYEARLNKSNNRISVYASPEGYPDRFTGKGQCTPRSG